MERLFQVEGLRKALLRVVAVRAPQWQPATDVSVMRDGDATAQRPRRRRRLARQTSAQAPAVKRLGVVAVVLCCAPRVEEGFFCSVRIWPAGNCCGPQSRRFWSAADGRLKLGADSRRQIGGELRCPSRKADSASTTSTDGGGKDGATRKAAAKDERVSSRPLRASGLNACRNTGSTSSSHLNRVTSRSAPSQAPVSTQISDRLADSFFGVWSLTQLLKQKLAKQRVKVGRDRDRDEAQFGREANASRCSRLHSRRRARPQAWEVGRTRSVVPGDRATLAE